MEGVESLERHQPPPLPRNVKVLGWVSFLNDVASEMIFPLLPQFLLTALGGNRFSLGVIEGIVDSRPASSSSGRVDGPTESDHGRDW